MVYPRELILFADGIWPMCTKVPGVECTEPEKECEDCDGADPEAVAARGDEAEGGEE
jgi:hypothetical protein